MVGWKKGGKRTGDFMSIKSIFSKFPAFTKTTCKQQKKAKGQGIATHFSVSLLTFNMPVRSSPAAEKAMNDGDFMETSHRSLAGDTITQYPSTRANLGDASIVGGNRCSRPTNKTKEEITNITKSSRTCRHHVVDGKPLLQRQGAAVWNRPSMARPRMPPWYADDDDYSSLSSLSLQTLESFSNYRMGNEMSSLTECDNDDECFLVDEQKQPEYDMENAS